MTSRAILPLALLAACGGAPQDEGAPKVVTPERSNVVFTDATAVAGIEFEHHHGRSGRKLLPETLGAGAVFFDADGDDWPDLYLVNSRPFGASSQNPTGKLYRNNRDGTFRDDTAAAGLAASFYGMGAAAADYDNDGDADLYLTALGPDRLFRNRGDGTFEEVTAAAGIDNPSSPLAPPSSITTATDGWTCS